MMRRGPLSEYPVDWVLRQAATHRVTGSIEFNSISPMTVYFNSGSVYHAIATVVPSDEQAPVDGRTASEPAAREKVAEVLAGSLTATDGWYYHDPLSRHEGHGPWQWAVEDLLADARTMTVVDRSLGPWAHVELDLLPAPNDRVSLSADAWAVVVELAVQVNTRAVRNRLDWAPDRLVSALDDLARAGAISQVGGDRGRELSVEADPARLRRPEPRPLAPRPVRSVSGAQQIDVRQGEVPMPNGSPSPSPSPSSPSADHAPAPRDEAGDRRGALRRLIANLRPT